MWLPSHTRHGDIFLMDYFISQRWPHTVLKILNTCRLFLQVITLADIVSADESYILPEAKTGTHLPYRHSILQWQEQGQPSQAAWWTWRWALSYLEDRGKLLKSLGYHINLSHQQWTIHFHPATSTVYVPSEDTYKAITPVVQINRRHTRASMPPIYDYSYYTLRQPPDSQELVNATIEGHSSLHPTVFHLNLPQTPNRHLLPSADTYGSLLTQIHCTYCNRQSPKKPWL